MPLPVVGGGYFFYSGCPATGMHTINNLNTAEENLTAAESRISDVDMAREMMSLEISV